LQTSADTGMALKNIPFVKQTNKKTLNIYKVNREQIEAGFSM
jgi:hypothetical protein